VDPNSKENGTAATAVLPATMGHGMSVQWA